MTATATKTRVGLENKAAIDAIVWTSNVLTSVFIVFVNKFLMDPKRGYGYVFATTLCSFHFFASGLAVRITEMLGYSAPAKLPRRVALLFSLVAGTSISTLNLSLLVNSVGFYQISKLLIIPYVCGVEAVWLKRKFTVPTIMCILLVIVGVGIVTVTDMSINPLGLVIAGISVITSGMQQILCGTVQRKHNLTSMQLLSNTAPIQGMMLLAAGPFIDQAISKQWVFSHDVSPGCMSFIVGSCVVAIAVNISQFMCLGRFSAGSFQVLGHAKTIIILLLGWLYWNDVMSVRKASGMALAVLGMIGYGICTSQPHVAATGSSTCPNGLKSPSSAVLETVTLVRSQSNASSGGGPSFSAKAKADSDLSLPITQHKTHMSAEAPDKNERAFGEEPLVVRVASGSPS